MAAYLSIRTAFQAIFIFSLVTVIAAALSPRGGDSASDANNPNFDSGSVFEQEMLNSTNMYRTMQGAAPLAWDGNLATYAQSAANGCVFEHRGGPYGENIAEACGSSQDTCQAYGNEDAVYSFSNPGFSEATGHFTQLVWKSTTTVGCGEAFCAAAHGWYVVCEYWPHGTSSAASLARSTRWSVPVRERARPDANYIVVNGGSGNE